MSSDALARLRSLVGDKAFMDPPSANTDAVVAQPVANSTSPGHGSSLSTSLENVPFASKDDGRNLCSLGASIIEEEVAAVSLEPIPQGVVEERIRGELGEPGAYCPIYAVNKLPYKYMDSQSTLAMKVSEDFFAHEKFWKRCWSLHYLHLPPDVSNKALIVVPQNEVRTFLDRINVACDSHIKLPKSLGFSESFGSGQEPRPRYLGLSNSKGDMQALENAIPAGRLDFIVSPNGRVVPMCPAPVFEDWKEKVKEMVAATKKNGERAKKRREAREKAKIEWSHQLDRLRDYLGLAHSSKSSRLLTSGIVFVAVDVEVYERNHSLITEIGVAFLDTGDLATTDRGAGGQSWISLVRGRHFWIREHSHLVNHEFVAGCPRDYEPHFGTTEMVSLNQAKRRLMQCFHDPRGCGRLSSTTYEGKPKIVLVGHDIEADFKYLASAGFDLTAAPNVKETLDTAHLWMALTGADQPTGLSSLLHQFNVDVWHPHNAGNDAAYTLQALVGIALKSFDITQEGPSDLAASVPSCASSTGKGEKEGESKR